MRADRIYNRGPLGLPPPVESGLGVGVGSRVCSSGVLWGVSGGGLAKHALLRPFH